MHDPLLSHRSEFPILDTCTYLVSHSLGAMPRATAESLQEYADLWSRRGVRAWAEGWWEMGIETANLLAPILGVPRGTITMHPNVTEALGVVASCFTYEGARRRIVVSELEFPSDMYLLEGFRRYGAEVAYVPSGDGIRVDVGRFVEAIDERTRLVVLSLVLFKSAAVTDVRAVIERAHAVGAHVALDVYQAAGTLPMDLTAMEADFAVGGSVKWLCGGPGAGYLYVRPDLASTLEPALVGWAAHAEPFKFETGRIRYADGARRFQSGTPNVPAYYAARAGYRIVAQIGVGPIRARSLRLTRSLIEAAEARGYRLNMPTDDRERGGTVVIDVPNGAAVADELLRREIIIDYRPGAGIRMAPHFYNTEEEIDRAVQTLDEIVAARVGG
jgi:kynureninase